MNDIETVFIFQDEFYTYSMTTYPIWMQTSNMNMPPTLAYGDAGYIPPPIISSHTQYKTYT
jgi:hypothetical protein